MTKIPLSTCCNAEVKTDCGDEGTCCFLCTGCGKPCNPNYGEDATIEPTEHPREVTKEIDPYWTDPNYDARYRQGYEDGVAWLKSILPDAVKSGDFVWDDGFNACLEQIKKNAGI